MQLGQNQKSETVTIYIADRSYVIKLDRSVQSSYRMQLDLPAGNYKYRIVTSSIYFGYRNVREQGRVRRQYAEQEIAGSGSGVLTVTGNSDLSLYGSYDKESGRMKVYLDERRESR